MKKLIKSRLCCINIIADYYSLSQAFFLNSWIHFSDCCMHASKLENNESQSTLGRKTTPPRGKTPPARRSSAPSRTKEPTPTRSKDPAPVKTKWQNTLRDSGYTNSAPRWQDSLRGGRDSISPGTPQPQRWEKQIFLDIFWCLYIVETESYIHFWVSISWINRNISSNNIMQLYFIYVFCREHEKNSIFSLFLFEPLFAIVFAI